MNYKETINEKTFMHLLWEFEEGRLETKLLVPLFQFLINEGHVWNLQNFYGALAMELIEEGNVFLVKVQFEVLMVDISHRDLK